MIPRAHGVCYLVFVVFSGESIIIISLIFFDFFFFFLLHTYVLTFLGFLDRFGVLFLCEALGC